MSKRVAVLGLLAAATLATLSGSVDAADRGVRAYGPGPRGAGVNRPVIVGATGVGVAASRGILHLAARPEGVAPDGPHRDVRVDPERALLHAAVRGSRCDEDRTELVDAADGVHGAAVAI